MAPWLGRAVFILVAYAVIAPGGELSFGVNADHLKASAGIVLAGLVLPKLGIASRTELVRGGLPTEAERYEIPQPAVSAISRLTMDAGLGHSVGPQGPDGRDWG